MRTTGLLPLERLSGQSLNSSHVVDLLSRQEVKQCCAISIQFCPDGIDDPTAPGKQGRRRCMAPISITFDIRRVYSNSRNGLAHRGEPVDIASEGSAAGIDISICSTGMDKGLTPAQTRAARSATPETTQNPSTRDLDSRSLAQAARPQFVDCRHGIFTLSISFI